MDDRRTFIMKMAAGMAATSLLTVSKRASAKGTAIQKVFVHHVFFWLNEPENRNTREQFYTGLQALVKVPQIQSYHIGTPVESSREVVDDSFSFSYMAFFMNAEDQAIYQTHPIHLKFVEDCQHLWKKVIVYDAIN